MSSNEFMGGAGQFAAGAGKEQRGPRYDLRPLSTGEVLDRTFQLYRSRFVLFVGIALLPAAVSTVIGVVRLVITALAGLHPGSGFARAETSVAVLSMVAGFSSIALYGIVLAATT